MPPLSAVMFLISAKSAGYMLYKEVDRASLLSLKIKNSITVVSKKTIVIISALLWLVSFSSFIFLCLEKGLIKLLNFVPFAIPPLTVIYLLTLNKVKTQIRYLRVIGFCYWILAIIITWVLFL
ncbi:MAG: hypothetical protein HYS02_02440 [Candidatus Staskawiczbacteria bacterium]|nr:hypothetical protein [Candidatus Staskawiczbacteria bacterium]